jgi:hypothetical protein
MSLLPSLGAQTPAIARFEAGKAELRSRRTEIVTARSGKLQKLLGHLYANGVGADIICPCSTTTIPIKPRFRRA